jgi:hypothetical protein
LCCMSDRQLSRRQARDVSRHGLAIPVFVQPDRSPAPPSTRNGGPPSIWRCRGSRATARSPDLRDFTTVVYIGSRRIRALRNGG